MPINDTIEEWEDRRLIDLISAAAEEYSDTPVLRYNGTDVTYSKLESNIWALADGLWASGIRPGERVGIVLEDIPEAIVSIIASSILGCPPLVLSVRNTPRELGYLLNTGDATTVITQSDASIGDLLDRFHPIFEGSPESESGVPSLERLIGVRNGDISKVGSAVDNLEFMAFEDLIGETSRSGPSKAVMRAVNSVSPDDTAIILFTSGTTSAPKAVIRTHRNIIPHGVDAADWYDISEGDVLLNAFPIASAAGILRFLMTVSSGATCILQDHYTLEETMDYLLQGGVNFLSGPDTIYKDILEHPNVSMIDSDPLKRVFLSMGGGLDVQFGAKVESAFETPIENAYGLTEGNPLLLRTHRDHPFNARVRPGGKVGYGNEICLKGGESRREICIRGISVTPGYDNNEAANEESFDDKGWFHTSDQGLERTIDGEEFCFFANRSDAMFQVGGFNVSPVEVEACLREHPSITWAGVAGINHERLGSVPGAVVTTSDSINPESITEFCESRLSDQKVPRTVFIIDETEIPYSDGAHGRKLDRKSLTGLLEGKIDSSSE